MSVGTCLAPFYKILVQPPLFAFLSERYATLVDVSSPPPSNSVPVTIVSCSLENSSQARKCRNALYMLRHVDFFL